MFCSWKQSKIDSSETNEQEETDNPRYLFVHIRLPNSEEKDVDHAADKDDGRDAVQLGFLHEHKVPPQGHRLDMSEVSAVTHTHVCVFPYFVSDFSTPEINLMGFSSPFLKINNKEYYVQVEGLASHPEMILYILPFQPLLQLLLQPLVLLSVIFL